MGEEELGSLGLQKMVFVPPKVTLSKPQMKAGSLSGKRCLILIVISLVVLVILLRALLNLRPTFISFHVASDIDGELVVVPKDFAEARRAACLDGSPPGFYIRKGFHVGKRDWILYLEPGGWCATLKDCYERSKTHLGSSEVAPSTKEFNGILSSDPKSNPTFHMWNMVSLLYCDGGSYAGSMANPVLYNGNKLYFQGFHILQTLMDFLIETTDLGHARRVILVGSSAGGLATFLHADFMKSKLPQSVNFHAMADGGIFLNYPGFQGKNLAEETFKGVFDLHNIKETPSVKQCINKQVKNEEYKCFFPLNNNKFLRSSIFATNSLYDTWTTRNFLQISCSYPKCDNKEKDYLDTHRMALLNATEEFRKNKNNGVYFFSCLRHTLLHHGVLNMQMEIDGVSLLNAIDSWYLKKTAYTQSMKIDNKFGTNPSCSK
ncbi:pectin acetylesterase 5 isoform X2 [Lingula anatina]|nr:pectin acetylesterase 5 isoform X2 [Lingula anatina]XP_013416560.1 pectin acetylesterase 5 isoform X2 [Lingula anatina]|eukprot:XP_013416559.1 pectin acetylesterase 5 isoform X2 [Lingula anatina]